MTNESCLEWSDEICERTAKSGTRGFSAPFLGILAIRMPTILFFLYF